MRAFRTRIGSGIALFLALFAVGMPRLAAAGCGCDHPPPAWGIVMPPFGSPGRMITIYAEGGEFTEGEWYHVDFGQGAAAWALAQNPDLVRVVVPVEAAPGPVALHLSGPGYDHAYDASLFTALPPALAVEGGLVGMRLDAVLAAVDAGGTLLLPVDLSQVLDAAQFAFELESLPLAFGRDDLVFYNADGVNLTIFELAVEDATQRQWGSYHGWEIDEDAGLGGVVYDPQVMDAYDRRQSSDVLTYWRHEFWTYAAAHRDEGSHVVDAAGYHPDGTFHVDHDSLVIAIAGRLRDKVDPANPELRQPLPPGPLWVTTASAQLRSDAPIEPSQMGALLRQHASQPGSDAAGAFGSPDPPPPAEPGDVNGDGVPDDYDGDGVPDDNDGDGLPDAPPENAPAPEGGLSPEEEAARLAALGLDPSLYGL